MINTDGPSGIRSIAPPPGLMRLGSPIIGDPRGMPAFGGGGSTGVRMLPGPASSLSNTPYQAAPAAPGFNSITANAGQRGSLGAAQQRLLNNWSPHMMAPGRLATVMGPNRMTAAMSAGAGGGPDPGGITAEPGILPGNEGRGGGGYNPSYASLGRVSQLLGNGGGGGGFQIPNYPGWYPGGQVTGYGTGGGETATAVPTYWGPGNGQYAGSSNLNWSSGPPVMLGGGQFAGNDAAFGTYRDPMGANLQGGPGASGAPGVGGGTPREMAFVPR